MSSAVATTVDVINLMRSSESCLSDLGGTARNYRSAITHMERHGADKECGDKPHGSGRTQLQPGGAHWP